MLGFKSWSKLANREAFLTSTSVTCEQKDLSEEMFYNSNVFFWSTPLLLGGLVLTSFVFGSVLLGRVEIKCGD